MRKTEAILRATLKARATGRTMYVYSLSKGLWSYASAAWINGLAFTPDELMEIQP